MAVCWGKPAGLKVGRPSPDQVEIARLKAALRRSERCLARTQAALEIMGKARELLEEISRSEPDERPSTQR
jgi:transposase